MKIKIAAMILILLGICLSAYSLFLRGNVNLLALKKWVGVFGGCVILVSGTGLFMLLRWGFVLARVSSICATLYFAFYLLRSILLSLNIISVDYQGALGGGILEVVSFLVSIFGFIIAAVFTIFFSSSDVRQAFKG